MVITIGTLQPLNFLIGGSACRQIPGAEIFDSLLNKNMLPLTNINQKLGAKATWSNNAVDQALLVPSIICINHLFICVNKKTGSRDR